MTSSASCFVFANESKHVSMGKSLEIAVPCQFSGMLILEQTKAECCLSLLVTLQDLEA